MAHRGPAASLPPGALAAAPLVGAPLRGRAPPGDQPQRGRPGTRVTDRGVRGGAAFYRSDERAAALSAEIAALAERPGDARLEHLVVTLGLSPVDTALFMLTARGSRGPGDRPGVRVPARRHRGRRSDALARGDAVRAARRAAAGPGLRARAMAARGAGRDRTRRLRLLDRLAGGRAVAAGARRAPRAVSGSGAASAARRPRGDRLVGRHERPHRRAAARSRAASRGTRGDRRLRADARAGAAKPGCPSRSSSSARPGRAGRRSPRRPRPGSDPGSWPWTRRRSRAARTAWPPRPARPAARVSTARSSPGSAPRPCRRSCGGPFPAAPLTFLSVETPVARTASAGGHRSIRRSIALRADRPARTPAAVVIARRHAGSHGGRRVGAAARRDLRRRAGRARRRPRGRRGLPAAPDGGHAGAAEPSAAPVRVGRPRALTGHGRAPARA